MTQAWEQRVNGKNDIMQMVENKDDLYII